MPVVGGKNGLCSSWEGSVFILECPPHRHLKSYLNAFGQWKTKTDSTGLQTSILFSVFSIILHSS